MEGARSTNENTPARSAHRSTDKEDLCVGFKVEACFDLRALGTMLPAGVGVVWKEQCVEQSSRVLELPWSSEKEEEADGRAAGFCISLSRLLGALRRPDVNDCSPHNRVRYHVPDDDEEVLMVASIVVTTRCLCLRQHMAIFTTTNGTSLYPGLDRHTAIHPVLLVYFRDEDW